MGLHVALTAHTPVRKILTCNITYGAVGGGQECRKRRGLAGTEADKEAGKETESTHHPSTAQLPAVPVYPKYCVHLGHLGFARFRFVWGFAPPIWIQILSGPLGDFGSQLVRARPEAQC
jgi:hypothetical protein